METVIGMTKRLFIPVSKTASNSIVIHQTRGLGGDCDGDCGQGDCDCGSDCGGDE
jgi:hypothetical protein